MLKWRAWSAHHLCIFSSNPHRQLNETLLKADKGSCHVHLIKHNKSSGKVYDHVRDYFRSFTHINRNKLGAPPIHTYMTWYVMSMEESMQHMQCYWFESIRSSRWCLRCSSKSLLVIADELVWGYWLLAECGVVLNTACLIMAVNLNAWRVISFGRKRDILSNFSRLWIDRWIEIARTWPASRI